MYCLSRLFHTLFNFWIQCIFFIACSTRHRFWLTTSNQDLLQCAQHKQTNKQMEIECEHNFSKFLFESKTICFVRIKVFLVSLFYYSNSFISVILLSIEKHKYNNFDLFYFILYTFDSSQIILIDRSMFIAYKMSDHHFSWRIKKNNHATTAFVDSNHFISGLRYVFQIKIVRSSSKWLFNNNNMDNNIYTTLLFNLVYT